MEKSLIDANANDEEVSPAILSYGERERERDEYDDEKNVDDSKDVSVQEIKQVEAEAMFDVEAADVSTDLNLTREDYLSAVEYAKNLTLEQTREIMKKVSVIHKHDPNFDSTIMARIQAFLADEDVFLHPGDHAHLILDMKIEAALITDNSPYAMVRAIVSNTDDPSMYSSTVRVWVLGMMFCGIASFINQFFAVRQPAISLSSNVAQLLSYPLAKAWEKTLPDWKMTVFGQTISLNPGPFNKKEHMLITIMANAGFYAPATTQIAWVQYLPKYFDQSWANSYAYQLLLGIGNTYLGFSLAGITRRFLVYPAHCVWPANMVTMALNQSFHSGDENLVVQGPFRTVWKASRMKAFLIAFIAMFVYFWIPDYLFFALSTTNWLTWIAPTNVPLAMITGSITGLGINPVATFDWNIVSSFVSPTALPLFTTLNYVAGAFVGGMMVLAIFLTNTFYTSYLPMNENGSYDRFGNSYNVSLVLNDEAQFDADKYLVYSPPYLAAGFVVVYLAAFSLVPAMLSYAYLYHRHEIWHGFKSVDFSWTFWRRRPAGEGNVQSKFNDVHNRLMSAYPEVPEWWFFCTALFAIICGCVGLAAWDTHTTPAVVIYGFAVTLVLVIPSGIITAITNTEVTFNIFSEFVGGLAFPGNGMSMNFFKYFGYNPSVQALSFASDMKLGHYLKIPPRHTFAAQMIAQMLACFVGSGVLIYQLDIPGVCTSDQVDKFTCPGVGNTFGATVLWGVLGPQKIFKSSYKMMLLAWPFGFLFPIPFYFIAKKYPNSSFLRSFHPIVFLNGGQMWAPYNLSYVLPAVPVAWFSMSYLKRYYVGFFSKYNYVVTAAFSVAIALCGLVLFGLGDQGVAVTWWGNTVPYAGVDADGWTWLDLPDVGYFGPGVGEFLADGSTV